MSVFKLTKEHQAKIKCEVDKVLTKYPDIAECYSKGEFSRSDQVQDLQKRLCHDILFATGLTTWICVNIYIYANDNHIYSFLKTICPKVDRKY